MTLDERQLNTLVDMLTYRRPAGSETEEAFRRRYVYPLPGAYCDVYGNVHVSVGTSPVLWSCHTDTVHWIQGRQMVHVDRDRETISLHADEMRGSGRGVCLGADDGTGVFICREMILRGIPGHYVFHYGEERGGIGSSALAQSDIGADWLSSCFTYAIALDRAGISDIITHQYGGRTCSDTFAHSLASQLPGRWEPCHGVYTDTAEYTDILPECTNLSVGYGRQHSADEFQHYGHVAHLLHALCNLDVNALVIGDKYGEEKEELRLAREAREARDRQDAHTQTRWKHWSDTLPPKYRPSQVDRINDGTVLDDDGRPIDDEDVDKEDYASEVWCDTCDLPRVNCECTVCNRCGEAMAYCICDGVGALSEDDIKFLKYLRGQ